MNERDQEMHYMYPVLYQFTTHRGIVNLLPSSTKCLMLINYGRIDLCFKKNNYPAFLH